MTSSSKQRLLRWVGIPTALALVAGLAQATTATADPIGTRPDVKHERSVPVDPVPVRPRPSDPEAGAEQTPPAAVKWPGNQALTATRDANVEILNRPDGVLLVARRNGHDSGTAPVVVELNYKGFRYAYGGDWSSRLRLMRLPACALTTPAKPECRTRTPIATTNNTKTSSLRAKLALPKVSAAAADGTPVAEPVVLAVTAAAGGNTGDYAATTLSPSSSWEVSTQTGDFAWSYPIRTPPAVGALEPKVQLSYASGAVDGRTSSTNNQTSWIGEGFEFSPGYIERSYKACLDDGHTRTGDMCWGSWNATMVLNGSGTELVRDDTTKTWRPKRDDGSRVELLTGAPNGDEGTASPSDVGEYWRVTTTDGTQYYFGKHRLPGWTSGKEETHSVWTAPVFGDDTGEPCNASTFATSWCQQAWRWNLDYVVAPNGNVMSFFYQRETNVYSRNFTDSAVTTYTRGGYLKRVDYGQQDGQVYAATAPQRVVFGVDERCLPTSTFDCAESKFTKENAGHWPDVPYDLHCAAGSGGNCAGRYTPTFWSRKRLTTITTQVGGANVERWTLRHAFPASGDGTSPALWLQSITNTGLAGGSVDAPPVSFDGTPYKNRVDGLEGLAPLYKRRLTTVHNETGGQVTVQYKGIECSRAALPTPDSNQSRCFPQRWYPPEGGNPVDDWFHKYVVEQTTQIDRTGGSPDQETRYEYLDGAGWRYRDDELVPAARRSWSDWRGYGRVKVRQGATNGTQSLTEVRFFRGLDGDRRSDGSLKDVWVTDSDGGRFEDHNALAGQHREEVTYNGASGPVVSKTLTDPWLRGPTAKHGSLEAWMVNTGRVAGKQATSTGGWRLTEQKTTFDSSGLPTQVEDRGDTTTTADDRCTRNEYARNTGAWMLTYVGRAETVAVPCAATPSRPADVVSDVRTYYDNATTHTAAPSKGLVTKTEELSGWDGGPAYTTVGRQAYDAYGRVTETYDALDKLTRTAYTPASGGPVTAMTVTNPLGHVTVSELNPAWGSPTAEIAKDAAGAGADRRTDLAYDPLGRLTKVWLPGRSKAAGHTPTSEFSYLVQPNRPVAVTTRAIKFNGEYVNSYEIYDGFLRPRQSQQPSPGGGRELSDTIYDARGLVTKRNEQYYNDQAPGTDLKSVADNVVAAQTVIEYDGAGRATVEKFRSNNADKWSTTYTHSADWSTVDPPAGGTATASKVDARGNLVELRQYKGGSPSGAYEATTYTYNKRGQQETVTDVAGNVWRNTYDLRGRQETTHDPDTGTTRQTFDAAGRVTSTTDEQERTLTYAYDDLGRKTAMLSGTTVLAEWKYDSLVKGYPTSSTRYVDGKAYVTSVTGYNAANLATGSEVTIPSVTGREKLAATYRFTMGYNSDGSLARIGYPAAGGLAAETVEVGYDDTLGLPVSLTGAKPYLTETTYSRYAEPLQYTLKTGDRAVWLTNDYEEGTRRLARARTDLQAMDPHLTDTHYAYDPAGNILRITDAPEGKPVDTQCFRYDHQRRMTQAWTRSSAAEDTCVADPTQSTVGGTHPYWRSYAYDLTGNRLTETQHASGGDTVRSYDYSDAGEPQPHALRSVTTTVGTGQPTVDAGYTYDDSGNTTGRTVDGAAQTLSWDAEGHLAKVTESGKTTSYVYDADGNRLLRSEPAGTTVNLGLMELNLDVAMNTVTAKRYYSQGSAVGIRTSPTEVEWLVSDHQGTAELAVDSTTLAASQRRFGPFGEARGPAPADWPDRKGFVGGTVSSVSGLVQLGAREYEPEQGRFISADPVMDPGEPQLLNAYAYANNSPVTLSDPSGLFPCMICGAWAGWGAGKAKKAVGGVFRKATSIARGVARWLSRKFEQAKKRAKQEIGRAKRAIDRGKVKVQQAKKRVEQKVNKAKNQAKVQCRLVFGKCSVGAAVDKAGIGKQFDPCDLTIHGSCRETLRHLSVELGYCAGICVAANFQDGRLRGYAGVEASLPGGYLGGFWNSEEPENQGAVSATGCAGYRGVAVCYGAGNQVDENGEWVGANHMVGGTVGTGGKAAMGAGEVAMYQFGEINFMEGTVTGPQDPLPPSGLRDEICESWWGWYC